MSGATQADWKSTKAVLQYIANVEGVGTLAQFIEDMEPIGARVWGELKKQGYVELYQGDKVKLTSEGMWAHAQLQAGKVPK